jgi:hypothetical protein
MKTANYEAPKGAFFLPAVAYRRPMYAFGVICKGHKETVMYSLKIIVSWYAMERLERRDAFRSKVHANSRGKCLVPYKYFKSERGR